MDPQYREAVPKKMEGVLSACAGTKSRYIHMVKIPPVLLQVTCILSTPPTAAAAARHEKIVWRFLRPPSNAVWLTS